MADATADTANIERSGARGRQLAAQYRAAIDAVERYLVRRGDLISGDILERLLDDLADLFEQSAAEGVAVRLIVGEDPVEFADLFLGNYAEGEAIDAERSRLRETIDAIVSGLDDPLTRRRERSLP